MELKLDLTSSDKMINPKKISQLWLKSAQGFVSLNTNIHANFMSLYYKKTIEIPDGILKKLKAALFIYPATDVLKI